MKKYVAILFIGMMHIGLASECFDMVKEQFTIEPFKSRLGAGLGSDIYNKLEKCEGEDRSQCEECIISAFEKVCPKIVIHEDDDFDRKEMWLVEFKTMYMNILPLLKCLRYDATQHLRIAKALGSIPKQELDIPNTRDTRYIAYRSYIGKIPVFRRGMIFTCCCRFYQIRKHLRDEALKDPNICKIVDKKERYRICDEEYDKFTKEFAEAAKMTKKEREDMSRRLDGLNLKW